MSQLCTGIVGGKGIEGYRIRGGMVFVKVNAHVCTTVYHFDDSHVTYGYSWNLAVIDSYILTNLFE